MVRPCSLCGTAIEFGRVDPMNALSMDHVPPKQFYPKELRKSTNNLWVVPTHRKCNEHYREDEEYFYHAMFALVQDCNEEMGRVLLRDFERRLVKPQTPALIRRVTKGFSRVTRAGIHMPPRIVQVEFDADRCQRVIMKIAQGLFFLNYKSFLPAVNCVDVRLCQREDDVPDFYLHSWASAAAKSVDANVFSYKHFDLDGLHLWSMLFWSSFMFCIAFKSPLGNPTEWWAEED